MVVYRPPPLRRRMARMRAAIATVPKKSASGLSSLKRDFMANINFGVAFNSVVETLSSAVTKVPFIVCTLVSTYLIFTCGPRYNIGIVGDFIAGSNNTISRWITQNPNDFTGFLVLLPGVFAAPTSLSFMYLLACYFWVSIVPPAQMYEYVIQSIGMMTMFTTRSKQARLTVLVFVLFAWFAGWFVIGPDSLNVNTLPLNNNNISMHSYRK